MDDDYWNSSSVEKKVSQQGIFDTDGNNTLDRYKNQSNPLIDKILDSSRSTPPINSTGSTSNHYRATRNNPPITTNIPPKNTIPTSQVPHTFDQPSGCKYT